LTAPTDQALRKDLKLVGWHCYDDDPKRWAATLAALADGTAESFRVTLGTDFVVTKALYADETFPRRGLPLLNSEYGGGFGSLERAWLLRWQTQEFRRHGRFVGYVYTELSDVEHEAVGLVDAWRHPKDLGGLDPYWVNAETVLVVDVTPAAPGADIALPTTPLTLTVHVSHHGVYAISGNLCAAWLPAGSTLPPNTVPQVAIPVSEVVPFRLSESYYITVPAPEKPARLHLWLENAGQQLAQTFIDVGTVRQPGRPDILSG
jgi:hypothetical protein